MCPIHSISSADPSSVAALEGQVRSQLDKLPGNNVLATFPSFSFFSSERPPLEEMIDRFGANPTRSRLVYVSYPFCIPTSPLHCGFCGFPKVDIGEQKDGGRVGSADQDEYVTYLGHHLELLERFAPGVMALPVSAIYFGGGTPNLLRPDEAARFVELVLGRFKVSPGAEVTFEGVPQLFFREKIEALREAGVNRVSVGVQQLKDHLIAYSGRKHRRDHVERAVEDFHALGLNFSLDFIYGWPGQTLEDALDDVRAAVEWRAPHLTIYPLNVIPGSAFSQEPYRSMIPGVAVFLQMYESIRDYLLSAGYRQITLSDFERVEGLDDGGTGYFGYESNSRDPLSFDWFGVGFSAVNRFAGTFSEPGVAFLTPKDLGDWKGQIDQGQLPHRAHFLYGQHPRDLELCWLANQLQQMRIPRMDYERYFGRDLIEEYASVWQALLNLGWIVIEEGGIRLVGRGVFYTPLIQKALTHGRVAQLRQGRSMVGYVSDRVFQIRSERPDGDGKKKPDGGGGGSSAPAGGDATSGGPASTAGVNGVEASATRAREWRVVSRELVVSANPISRPHGDRGNGAADAQRLNLPQSGNLAFPHRACELEIPPSQDSEGNSRRRHRSHHRGALYKRLRPHSLGRSSTLRFARLI